ncbi:GxxExxY protein [Novosphingobium sp.]|uniref:GxxExxY protein n=1 Tax=Novosphingobium sp. TaxID=1874826 RepID=UPI002733E752|nr:GxxExxY protein [Novosphingobium sp.]MDP3906772.1 GxxExxY protein [Novosphingobium sp.]
MQDINDVTSNVVAEAIRIHRELGPGLLESVYEAVLAATLARRGYQVKRQVAVNIEYDGLQIEGAFRVDLLIEGTLILEIKAVEQLTKVHAKQLLTYLRLMKQPVGLLLNFSGLTMKEGIRRLVNDYRPGA